MMIFALIAIAMTALGLVVVVYPLFSSYSNDSDDDHSEQNIDIARQQLQQLEDSHKAGDVEESDYHELHNELEQTLAVELSKEQNSAGSVSVDINTPHRLLPTIIGFIFPIAVGMLYFMIGTPAAITSVATLNAPEVAAQQVTSDEDVNQLMRDLKQRLTDNPEDVQGWTILARSSMALENYNDAVKAYERVNSLDPDNADILVQYADALAMVAGGILSGKPAELLQQALIINPDQPQGLWLGGMAAQRQGEYQTALDLWNRLLPQLADDPQTRAQLLNLIKDLRANAAQENVALVDQSSSNIQPVENNSASIGINLKLADEFKDSVSDDMFVFVFAQAVDGPPMPVAAARITVRDLPALITLTDENAMVPELRLSNFDVVNVTARISKSGQPMAQPGDIEVIQENIKVADLNTLDLVISTIHR